MIRAAILAVLLAAPARAAQVFGPASTLPNSVASMTFTSSGTTVYSVTSASSIHILSGGITWPDGTRSAGAAGGTDLSAVGAATAALQAQFVTVGVDTAALSVRINATAASTGTLSLAVGISTAGLRTDLTAAGVSTAAIQAQLNLTAASTGTLATAVGASTLALQNQFVTVGISTMNISTASFTSGFNAASNLVQLDGSARLPAVDGSQLTNLPSAGEANTYGSSKTFTSAVKVTSATLVVDGTGAGLNVAGPSTATFFYGNGSGLTNVGGVLSGGLTGALPVWTAATTQGNSAFTQGTSSVTLDAAHQMLLRSTFTAQSQANFTNAAGTQTISTGFSARGGANSLNGLTIVGSVTNGLRVDADVAGTGDIYIENLQDSTNADILIGVRGQSASPLSVLRLQGSGEVTVLPDGGGPATPFKVGSTVTLTSDGTLTINSLANTNSVTASSGVVITAGNLSNGWEKITNACGAGVTTCTATCSALKVVMGGGCSSDVGLSDSFPATNMTWECDTLLTATLSAYALCSRMAP